MTYRMGLVLTAMLFCIARAEAGTLTNGTWTSSGCGKEPTAPTIDLSSESAFGKSLDAGDAYDAADAKYVDCMVTEGNVDANVILSAAKTAQDNRKAARAKLQADTDAGMAQYAKKKKK